METRKGRVGIKPITDKYIERMAGMTGTKGKLLKALKEERTRECRDLPDPAATDDSTAPASLSGGGTLA